MRYGSNADNCLGKGSFGVIRRVRRISDGLVRVILFCLLADGPLTSRQILCRKEVNYVKMGQKEREQLYAEFSILSSLRHPNIVAYYHRSHLKETQDLHLYMEYCGGGDLSKLIKDLTIRNQYADEAFVWSIFSQLATALYRCHYGVDPPEAGTNIMGLTGQVKPPPGLRSKSLTMILHRDLKPDNSEFQDHETSMGAFTNFRQSSWGMTTKSSWETLVCRN